MQFKNLLTKTLLAVALLGGVNSAWAYDTPDGYGVSKVFIGTAGSANANGIVTTVTEDPFDYESVPATFANQTGATLAIESKTYVENAEVGSTPAGIPSYVNGNSLKVTVSGTNDDYHFGRYTLDNGISTGYLVFRADMYGNPSPTYIRFLDEEGNTLLTLGFQNGSGIRYYRYNIGNNCDMNTIYRTYPGLAIEDLVINMATGAVNFNLDYINTNNSNKRSVTTCTKNIKIGTGKTIKYLELGSIVNKKQSVYFDNIKFYHVDTYANLYTTYKTDNYGTKVSALDAAGQAYWTANTAPTITTAAQYKSAIDALPATYVSAVKAQTTGGSNMTDAMPQALTDWTCSQGNGPGTYATTFTETYSDGKDTYAKFSAGTIMSQTITGLPNGYYKVQFYGIVNAANNVSTVSGTNLVQAYANTSNLDIDVIKQNACTPTDYLRTIEAQVTDGTLTYGLKAKDGVTDAGNWAVAKIYALTYLGSTKYDYTINAVAGGSTIKTLATGSEFPSDSYGVYIPKVIYNDTDSKYYVLDDDDNANLDGYYASYTMGTTDATKEINYTVDESIVFYSEAQGNGYYTTEYTDNKNYSNGNTVQCITSQNHGNARNRGINVGDLGCGIYSFYAIITGSGRSLSLRVNEGDYNSGNVPLTELWSTGTKNFSIDATSTIVITGSNQTGEGKEAKSNHPASFDYLIIRKLNVNDSPVIVGDINNGTGYLAATSEKVTLTPGESYHYQFVNHNSGSASQWLNYVVPIYDANDEKILAIRADNWEDVKGSNAGCNSDFVWGTANATFIAEMNGATVDMTIAYSTDNVLTMNASIATNNYNWTYTYKSNYTDSGISLTGNLKVALSVSNSWLEILSEGYSAVPATLGANGFTTFASSCPLDLTALPDGLTAYKAAVSGTKVRFTELDQKVPANTGILLQGTASDTYSIPVAAEGTTVTENDFLVNETGAIFDATPGYTYFALIKDSDPLVFGTFNPATLAMPASKAYLKVSNGNAARLTAVFGDDETTGINAVNNQNGKGEYFNLNGQRVESPKKGLYIVDGKKVVRK